MTSASSVAASPGTRTPVRVNSHRKEEIVDLSGRNAVVTFDLRCVNGRTPRSPANGTLRPSHSSRASILKREKSM